MSDKSTATVEAQTLDYRLPRQVLPDRYEIKLTPDLQNFTFTGDVVIDIDVVQQVKKIVLNALELKVSEAYVTEKDGTKYSATLTQDEENERLQLSFDNSLNIGPAKISLKFVGILNDKLHGFYRSTYKDTNGEQKVIATTQFEATDARRAFPCFDEPDFKASYKVTLIVDKNLQAISNAGIDSENQLPNNKKEVVFKETVKMSTYLVAFIVGEFEATEPIMAHKTPIRIWAPPGKKSLATFAQGIAKHSLEFFANYYGVPYPGDKLDLIAIPDFASGAMENLGAVTFRETALLVDEKLASHSELERVADVVAHEIAHMWFGDLTTMSWWNGIWLNEAFATFMEMMAVDAWKPNWKRWDSFGASRAAALVVDGLKSTRPIEFEVKHPDECRGMFDVLTYEKGASVLRMLEQYIGVDVFQKGISIYLNRHKFANTETHDLWHALEEASKLPVGELMESWIFQKGYPMISVKLSSNGKTLELSQQRFFYLQDNQEKNQVFHIPIMIRAKTAKGIVQKKFLLKEERGNIDLDEAIEWAVVNEEGHGFYRVHYDQILLNKFTSNLMSTLSAIERFNLVNDTWAMTVAGHLDLTSYLKLVKLFKEETDKNVWSVIVSSLQYLDRVIEEADRSHYEKFVQELLSHIFKQLGWVKANDENELVGQLRGTVINALGTFGKHLGVQKEAAEYYAKFKKDKNTVDPNIVPSLISILAKSGDKTRYDEFYHAYKNAKSPQEEERYLYSLAAFKDTSVLKQTLQMTIDGEVKTQNAPYLLRYMMLMNTTGRELAWQFTKEHWQEITTKFPDNSISRMLEGITALVKPQLESDIAKFLKANPVKEGAKTVEQHFERLSVAVLFKKREANNFKQAFN